MFGVIKNNTKFKHTANQLVSDFLIQLYFFEVKAQILPWKYMLSANLYDLSILIQDRIPGKQALGPNKQDLSPDEE